MRTQQDRTLRKYNLQICDSSLCDVYGWPIVAPMDVVPDKLVTFEVARSGDCSYSWGHFFIDDYRFERLWNQPERYVDVIRRYEGVLSPDFSLYTDMPLPLQVYNSYRSKALASYWQRCGIQVVPTLCWSDHRSYSFAFQGWPRYSTVAVSTVGVMRDKRARQLFADGLGEAISQLEPTRILWYGNMLECDTQGVETVHYENDNHRRVKQWEDEGRPAAGAVAEAPAREAQR